MPVLIEKMESGNTAVRAASTELQLCLLQQLPPKPVAAALTAALLHSNWRVREGALDVMNKVPSMISVTTRGNTTEKQ